MKKLIIIVFAIVFILACSNTDQHKADMYEASPLAAMMRKMVDFSEKAKINLAQNQKIKVPKELYSMPYLQATRNESEESVFQEMAKDYIAALEGIEREDSQAYYYSASIKACKNCHSVYCGGPMAVINTLD